MDMTTSTRELPANPFRHRTWRDLARFAGEALAAGLLVSVVLATAIFIAVTEAQSFEPERTPVAAASGDTAGGR
jgi:hypothetical protein